MSNLMKKFLVMMVSIMTTFVLTGSIQAKEKPIVTVTTSFLQDMVEQLAGDDVEIQTIIPAGEDPHLYQAKPQDLKKLKQTDLILYHGLHFEGKMVDLLEDKGVAVSENFKPSEIGQMEEDGQQEVDPHFWFDISLYKKATERAYQALVKIMPDQKNKLEEQCAEYLKALDDLDNENRERITSIPKKQRYLITPHDAFNYFSRRYDMPVRSPQGVTTDSEVSNKDIDDTVNFIVDHKIPAIFAESTTDPGRMKKLQDACAAKGFNVTVIHGEGQELFSDSLAPKGQDGDTYIDMYRHNVDLIVSHLK